MSARADLVHAEAQRGLATVEFVICAPVLMLLMFATAEIGRLLYQYNTLNKAVRDGVRYAITKAEQGGSTGVVSISTTTRDQTRNLVVTGNTAGSGTAVLPGLIGNNVNVSVTQTVFVAVSATYTYQPMLGNYLPSFGFGGDIQMNLPLTATVVMRVL